MIQLNSRKGLFVLSLFCACSNVFSQSFNEAFNPSISQLGNIRSAVADLNKDGFPELVISGLLQGEATNFIISYSGTSYIVLENVFEGAPNGDVVITDLTRDGLLEVVFTKVTDIEVGAKAFRNLGNLDFQEIADAFDINYLIDSSVGLDLDNDGRKELINSLGQVYKSDSIASPQFYFSQSVIPEAQEGENFKRIVYDLNNDGLLDLIYINERLSKIQVFQNSGGSFIEGLSGEFNFNIQSRDLITFGDFDGDGFFEIVLNTRPDLNTVLKTFEFIPEVGFEEQTAQEVVLSEPLSVFASDLNQDGILDLVITENVDGQIFTEVYNLNDQGQFESNGLLINAVYYQESTLLDIDQDGDLDLFSRDQDNWKLYASILYDATDPRQELQAPQNLSVEEIAGQFKLRWDKVDAVNSSEHFVRYQLSLFNQEQNVFSAPSYVQLNYLDFTQYLINNEIILSYLPNGNFDVKVRAIDVTGKVGQWSQVVSFTVDYPSPAAVQSFRVERISTKYLDLAWDFNANTSKYVVYRKLANEQNYPRDPLAIINAGTTFFKDETVHPETEYVYGLYAVNNQARSSITELEVKSRVEFINELPNEIETPFSSIDQIEWVDFEGDGQRELIVKGEVPNSGIEIRIISNLNSNVQVSQNLWDEGGIGQNFHLIDVNQDGLIDIGFPHRSQDSEPSGYKILLNKGQLNFERVLSNEYLDGVDEVTDFYRDTKLDFVIVENGRLSIYETIDVEEGLWLIKNQVELPITKEPGELKLIDIDGDNDIDIYLNYYTELLILKNEGGFSFTIDQIDISGLGSIGQSNLKNLDEDIELELLVNVLDAEGYSAVYNITENGLEELQRFEMSSYHLMDFNGDGSLDLVSFERGGVQDPSYIEVMTNNGLGVFEEYYSQQILGDFGDIYGPIDYDLDYDEDFVAIGSSNSTVIFYLLENTVVPNNIEFFNEFPALVELVNLTVNSDSNSIEVEWSEAYDQESDKLTYRAYIKDRNDNYHISKQSDNSSHLLSRSSFYSFFAGKQSFGCIPNGEYQFLLQTVDVDNKASGYYESDFFQIEGTAPVSVSGLTANVLSNKSIRLNWTDESTSESSYLVYWKAVEQESFSNYAMVQLAPNIEEVIISDLAADTEYEFKVIPYNCAFESASSSVQAKTFTLPYEVIELTSALEFDRLFLSDLGDYDNDGDIDLLIAYRNDQGVVLVTVLENTDGAYTDLELNLETVKSGEGGLKWIDANADGNLDINLVGQNSNGVFLFEIYSGNGEGGFAKISTSIASPVDVFASQRKPIWADIDGNGKLDATVIIGGGYMQLFNKGGNVFEPKVSKEERLIFGNMPYTDFDKDGDLDLFVVSNTSGIQILQNDGAGNFQVVQTPVLSQLESVVAGNGGNMVWADVNNDGWQDILLSGVYASTRLTGHLTDTFVKIFLNDGNGDFDAEHITLPAYNRESPLYVHDFDNDGDMDIMMHNRQLWNYQNNQGDFVLDEYGSGTETDLLHAYVTDFDSDGDLDLLAFGEGNKLLLFRSTYVHGWFRNNNSPSMISEIKIQPVAQGVELSWSAPSDDLTSASQLRYFASIFDITDQKYVLAEHQNNLNQKTTKDMSFINSSGKLLFRNTQDNHAYYIQIQTVDANGRVSGFRRSLDFNLVSAINSEATNLEIMNAYPNPSENEVQLELNNSYYGNVYLTVVDQNGNNLFSDEFHKSDKEIKRIIELGKLSTGIYILKVQLGDSLLFKRIIKK